MDGRFTWIYELGYTPIAPHLMFPQFMDGRYSFRTEGRHGHGEGYNVGEVVLQDGQYLEDRSPVEGSKEAFELTADIPIAGVRY